MQGDDPVDLRTRMAEAAAKGDFEAAARLRDQLAALTGDASDSRAGLPQSRICRQVLGKMGLGTDQPAYLPPEGWTPPKKPDPMTSNHKPGGRRRS